MVMVIVMLNVIVIVIVIVIDHGYSILSIQVDRFNPAKTSESSNSRPKGFSVARGQGYPWSMEYQGFHSCNEIGANQSMESVVATDARNLAQNCLDSPVYSNNP
jgi:uncharacterized protein YxeA